MPAMVMPRPRISQVESAFFSVNRPSPRPETGCPGSSRTEVVDADLVAQGPGDPRHLDHAGDVDDARGLDDADRSRPATRHGHDAVAEPEEALECGAREAAPGRSPAHSSGLSRRPRRPERRARLAFGEVVAPALCFTRGPPGGPASPAPPSAGRRPGAAATSAPSRGDGLETPGATTRWTAPLGHWSRVDGERLGDAQRSIGSPSLTTSSPRGKPSRSGKLVRARPRACRP